MFIPFDIQNIIYRMIHELRIIDILDELLQQIENEYYEMYGEMSFNCSICDIQDVEHIRTMGFYNDLICEYCYNVHPC